MSSLARLPLRVQLTAAVVLLSAVGLLISGFAASTALKGYLLDRVDSQLVGLVDDRGGPPGGRRCGPDRSGEDTLAVVFRLCVPRGGSIGVEYPARGKAGPLVPDNVPTSPTTVSSRVSREADWRLVGAQGQFASNVYAINLEDLQATTRRLLVLESVIGAVVLLLLGAAGYVVIRRSLRPLVAVESTAEALASGDLTQRAPEGDPRTEVGSLSQSFNAMAARIEQSFAGQATSEAAARASEERMRRFVGDASHELRTPLTSIRGFAELYRQGALSSRAEVDRAMSRVESEASRMGLLVEDLLLLARLDQQRPLERTPVDLLELARDAVLDARAVDPERSVELEVDGSTPVVVGDGPRLRQVLGNLVGNALTHSPSPVRVRVSSGGGVAVVEVVDEGPGIPEEDRARVFERFYRADASRTRASGGSGLGLSIVAALVAAHAGTVTVEETPGGGATFRVQLPVSEAATYL